MILIGVTMPIDNQINDYFQYANEIIVYNNGNEISFLQDTDDFKAIIDELNSMCYDSHEMPAFSVSIDNETKTAMKNGVWIELVFDQLLVHNEMPFDRLLFQVNSDFSGFNIVRHYQDKYDGRCFYLNLENDMCHLYNTLVNR